MYASSFILTLERVTEGLEQALALEAFRPREPVLRIVDDVIVAIDDVGELTTVALRNPPTDVATRIDGDDAVIEILESRIDHGFDAELPAEARDVSRAVERVVEVDGEIFVPVGRDPSGVRNWWLLTDFLIDWLDELIDGFRRVHRRTQVSAAERVETAVWTAAERLAALCDAIDRARAYGSYVTQSIRRETADLVEGIGRLTTTITGGDNA